MKHELSLLVMFTVCNSTVDTFPCNLLDIPPLAACGVRVGQAGDQGVYLRPWRACHWDYNPGDDDNVTGVTLLAMMVTRPLLMRMIGCSVVAPGLLCLSVMFSCSVSSSGQLGLPPILRPSAGRERATRSLRSPERCWLRLRL